MSIPLDYFLNNPELNQRHELALPTDEMYRFIPPSNEILLPDSNPENNYRFIFNGQPKTDFEQKKLTEFVQYESKNGKLNYPPSWLESDTMRLLQASGYDMKKTYNIVKDSIEFVKSYPVSINNKIISLLNMGFMYVYGRDHHFRPIIYVSIKKYVKDVDTKIYSFQDVKESIIYLLNYVIKYILIPGQIENWVVIIDFKGTGLSDVSEFKKLFEILNKHRGRVFRNYIINISGFLKMAINTAVGVFGSSTAKKLRILGPDELNKLQEIISPDNLQKNYGGSAPDVIDGGNNLFPPKMPSTNFALNGEKLNIISEEAYKEMCLNSNPYKPFVISPKYLEKWNKEKEMEKERDKEKENELAKLNEAKLAEKKLEEKKVVIEPQISFVNKMGENRISIRKNNREYIHNFLKEFEFDDFKLLENMEDSKYKISKPNINLSKFTTFFDKIPKITKMYL